MMGLKAGDKRRLGHVMWGVGFLKIFSARFRLSSSRQIAVHINAQTIVASYAT